MKIYSALRSVAEKAHVLFFTAKAVAILATAFSTASVGALLVCRVVEWSAHSFGFHAYHVSPADFTSFIVVGGVAAVVATLLYVMAEA